MITGEFSGLWRRRLEALETVHGHQRLRFESLVRIPPGASRRRRICSRAAWAGDRRPCAKRCARWPTSRSSTEVGARRSRGRSSICSPPSRRSGRARCSSRRSPTRRCPRRRRPRSGRRPSSATRLSKRRCAGARSSPSIPPSSRRRPGRGRAAVVLAAPLEDVEGRLWGVLAVSDLPFSAYGPEARARIAALAGHVADLLAFGAPRRLAGPHHEESVEGFTRRLRRAAHDRRTHGIASGVVQFSLEGNRAAGARGGNRPATARHRRGPGVAAPRRARDRDLASAHDGRHRCRPVPGTRRDRRSRGDGRRPARGGRTDRGAHRDRRFRSDRGARI